jgi:hypothetical protein
MPLDVTCPTCNTVSHLEEVGRNSTCFCSTCDYPLFWAIRTSFAGAPIDLTEGVGLRRLPGTEGWAIVEQLTCPACYEPNLLKENFCVRCGADLHPKPPPPIFIPASPLPDLEPPPSPPHKRTWLLPVAVVVALVVELFAVWLVGAYIVY